jgi:hypothetical protein
MGMGRNRVGQGVRGSVGRGREDVARVDVPVRAVSVHPVHGRRMYEPMRMRLVQSGRMRLRMVRPVRLGVVRREESGMRERRRGRVVPGGRGRGGGGRGGGVVL